MKAAGLLLALAACGRIGFDGLGAGDDNPGGDGGPGTGNGDGGGDAASLCLSNISCTFPGGLPCSCWGSPTANNAGLNESNGTLRITPNANTVGAQGACTKTAVPLGLGGTFVEVSGVVSGSSGLTALQLGTSPNVFEIAVTNGVLQTDDGSNQNMVAYDPVAMRWWRIRPIGSAGTVFEVSPDGKTWSVRTISARIASAAYDVQIIAGTITAIPAPGSASFEGINICPP